MVRKVTQEMLARPVFTTGEIAAMCNVAPRTVSKWFDTGKLKGYRIPGSEDRRVTPEELLKFFQTNNMPTWGLEFRTTYTILLSNVDALVQEQIKDQLLSTRSFLILPVATAFDLGMQIEQMKPKAVVLDFSLGRTLCIQLARSILARFTVRTRPFMIAIVNEDEDNPEELFGFFQKLYSRPVDVPALVHVLMKEMEYQHG
jgi:two-component system response regulator RpaA